MRREREFKRTYVKNLNFFLKILFLVMDSASVFIGDCILLKIVQIRFINSRIGGGAAISVRLREFCEEAIWEKSRELAN